MQDLSRKPCQTSYHCYAYLNMDGDEIEYVCQAAQGVKLIASGREICSADILENCDHVEDKLHIGLSMTNFCRLQRSALNIVERSKVCVNFVLKHTYFDSLNNSVKRLSKNMIERLMLTEPCRVQLDKSSEHQSIDQYKELCSPDQFEALKMITLTSSISEPVVIIGPSGTGKSRTLALASHYFFRRPSQKSRILVCTHQRTSADTFLLTFLDLKCQLPETTGGMPEIFLVRNYGYHNRKLDSYHRESRSVIQHLDRKRHYLLVTTSLTAPHLSQCGFFTHIMIDEGAQMREPEAIAPLCMANNKTKIIIAGDPQQVT